MRQILIIPDKIVGTATRGEHFVDESREFWRHVSFSNILPEPQATTAAEHRVQIGFYNDPLGIGKLTHPD